MPFPSLKAQTRSRSTELPAARKGAKHFDSSTATGSRSVIPGPMKGSTEGMGSTKLPGRPQGGSAGTVPRGGENTAAVGPLVRRAVGHRPPAAPTAVFNRKTDGPPGPQSGAMFKGNR